MCAIDKPTVARLAWPKRATFFYFSYPFTHQALCHLLCVKKNSVLHLRIPTLLC